MPISFDIELESLPVSIDISQLVDALLENDKAIAFTMSLLMDRLDEGGIEAIASELSDDEIDSMIEWLRLFATILEGDYD